MIFDFALTEEQEAVGKLVRDFVDREIAPHIREWDAAGHFDRGILRRLAAFELIGLCIPEQYGGGAMDYNTLAIVCDELEHGDTAFRTAVSVHTGLISLTLLQWARKRIQESYLAPRARGEQIGAFGLTEPDAGSDVAAMRTTATRDVADYILNGAKTWISLCDVADNLLIFAYTDPRQRHNGISCFIVEHDFPGVTTRAIQAKLGIRAGNTGAVILDGVRVPPENRLGEEGEGFKIAMSALDNGRFTVAAGACGLINACLEASLKYCHERVTFGQEIGRHQRVQQMIAKMVAGLETSRLLVYRAGWPKNLGRRTTRDTSLGQVARL